MNLFALVLCSHFVTTSDAVLLLEKVREVDDPRGFDLSNPVTGDRGVPTSCSLPGGIKVTLDKGTNARLEVIRGESRKSIVVENVAGLARATLACGPADDFYYANPRLGRVYAYSATRLLRGKDPVVWTHRLEPFKSLDDVAGVMTDASVATAVQVRRELLLIEWFYRTDGTTAFWHEVLDRATGGSVSKLGPSDMLLKTNESDPWWILFQGGGNETANYVPQRIYRLSFGAPNERAKSAAETIEALRTKPPHGRTQTVAGPSRNPVINHMIALLSPTRTAQSPRIEFCPAVPPQRARYWLGAAYDTDLASLAHSILLAFWAERQASAADVSPIDAWFQTDIAPREPMKTLLAHFDPHDDAWVAEYQRALLELGRPTLERLVEKYGVGRGAIIRVPR